MDKEQLIEKTKQHIHNLRAHAPLLQEKEFKIALGKVIIDLKDAKKYDNKIIKKLFTLKD